jgi:hypothetical protein
MKKCEICNITFENGRVYSNHIRWVHRKIEYTRKPCPYCNKPIRVENYDKHLEACLLNFQVNKKVCKHCGKNIAKRKCIFCDRKCAAEFNKNSKKDLRYITEEWKENISLKIKQKWKEGVFKMPREIFSSKREREIVAFIKEAHPDDGWKTGGRLILNKKDSIARDLWSDSLKVCFEYDGIWHFENIKNQLEKKQNKDRLLELWCIENDYRLIRVDENSKTSLEQIENLIYNDDRKIIKIGSRYK